MNKNGRRNVAASVRQRLLNLAHERREDYNYVLSRYAVERFLYRLSISAWRDRFLLKGAFLFFVWEETPHRPTRDVDLLAFGDDDPAQLLDIFLGK